MPRRPRLHIPGGVYHATMRGNHRQAIFRGDDDYREFEAILCEALERYGVQLMAYCWMTNHVHLALRIAEAPLGRIMRLLASRYARRQQRTIPTTGHLFERRYRERLVDSERHLAALVRYIHLNPVRAGIVCDPCQYPWSSHRGYLGGAAPPWLSTTLVLESLGMAAADPLVAYRELMEQPVSEEDLAHIRTTGPCAPPQQRMEERPAQRAEALPIASIAEAVAVAHAITIDELLSARRHARLVQARIEVAHRALAGGAATLTDVAMFLRRSPSTISELISLTRRRR